MCGSFVKAYAIALSGFKKGFILSTSMAVIDLRASLAGDAQELSSIDTVYGSGDAGRSPSTPLLIGSVKSNMGHCEGGSGLACAITLLNKQISYSRHVLHCTFFMSADAMTMYR